MGREVRRVPKDWQHPSNDRGGYLPLYDNDFATAAAEWRAGLAEWEGGEREAYRLKSGNDYEYWEWDSKPPDRARYRPPWREEDRTHYQMYETVSEGTPLSPPFATPEDLARWLADNKASAGPYATATYDQWLAMIRVGYAPSMVARDGKIQSGVEFVGGAP